jgi:hypothetical protein
MQRRQRLNNPNVFCYICGSFVVRKTKNITSLVKTAYFAYFGIKLGDQDKLWSPHTVCSVSVEDLRNWTKGKRKALQFSIPMVWRQPINHVDDCYCCMCTLKGFNTKNKKEITYPNLPSAIRLVPHGPDIPVPNPPKQLHTLEAEVPLPMNRQRILNVVLTHMTHLNLSPKLN